MFSAMDPKLVTMMHFLFTDEGFWSLDRILKVNEAPTQINILLPVDMRVTLDSEAGIAQYIYRMPDREISFDPKDVVHFKLPDPTNWLRGHSPARGIRYALESHMEATNTITTG